MLRLTRQEARDNGLTMRSRGWVHYRGRQLSHVVVRGVRPAAEIVGVAPDTLRRWLRDGTVRQATFRDGVHHFWLDTLASLFLMRSRGVRHRYDRWRGDEDLSGPTREAAARYGRSPLAVTLERCRRRKRGRPC